MGNSPALCHEICQQDGWYRCPHCRQFYCFVHCVGHGCDHRFHHTTTELPSAIVSAVQLSPLFHPFCWDHLAVALRSCNVLYLRDASGSRVCTLSALFEQTCYRCEFRPFPRVIVIVQADTLEECLFALAAEQQQMLLDLLDDLALRGYDASRPASPNEQEGQTS